MFCTSSMILLKVVGVFFGVVLCFEICNVFLHFLPTSREVVVARFRCLQALNYALSCCREDWYIILKKVVFWL